VASDHLVARFGALAGVTDRVVGLDDVTAPVVVGCSGGPDSLTLLAVAVDRRFDPIAVHVDHGLRDGSDAEGATVVHAAQHLGARVDLRRVEVAPGGNLEARAREARYQALHRAADEHGARDVLVGHTADDQAETVLLALLRGSGSAGLAGMAVRRDRIVRPLLEVRRADTEASCVALGLDPVRDPTNEDTSYRRAWIRHVALPLLSTGSSRDLVPVLTRQAGVLREESAYLDSLARAAWPPDADTAVAASLVQLPGPLARRAVRCWLGSPPPSFDEVERVLAVARGEARATQLAGGRRVRRTRGRLVVDETGAPGAPRSAG
jgi:tRNA(Ile)-lysidine synthase